MRDYNEELKARNRRHHIADTMWFTLAFIGMFLLFFWMATTI